MSLNPEEAWVRANIREATAQIEALQVEACWWAEECHRQGFGGDIPFEECDHVRCRKLRDRLKPLGRIESGTYGS